jgi:hypothetical protein
VRFQQANFVSALIDFTTAGIPFEVSGNLIRNNDFGTTTGAPVIAPASGFIDGGGNVCQAGSFLRCFGSADVLPGLSGARPSGAPVAHAHPSHRFPPRALDRGRR